MGTKDKKDPLEMENKNKLLLKIIKEEKDLAKEKLDFNTKLLCGEIFTHLLQFIYLILYFKTGKIFYLIISPIIISAMITSILSIIYGIILSRTFIFKLDNNIETSFKEKIIFVLIFSQFIAIFTYAFKVPYFDNVGFSILITYFILRTIIEIILIIFRSLKNILYIIKELIIMVKSEIFINAITNKKISNKSIMKLLKKKAH